MAKSRLIFTLLLQENSYMLSRNFELQEVGDLSWIRKFYNFDAISCAIDELVVLNVGRDNKNIKNFAKNLISLSENCFMPITAGGGIQSLEDAFTLLGAGADKLVVNRALYGDPELVRALINTFGEQCIVASIDYKIIDNAMVVFTADGKVSTGMRVDESVRMVHEFGCGEIYLTSMDQDGTGEGLDLETIKDTASRSQIPIIASGGVGKFQHFVEGIRIGNSQGVSSANLFNFISRGLIDARNHMRDASIDLATWDLNPVLSSPALHP